mgnify:CR=1 FL=1
MKISYFLSSILITLLYNSCKKEPKSCVGFVPYPQMVKDYLLFKDSSYWIYKDSATGTLDSFWVKDYEKQSYWPYKETGTRDCPCYEEYKYKINRVFTDNVQEIRLQSYHYNKGKEKEKFYGEFVLRGINYFYRSEKRFSTVGYDSIWNETPVKGGYIFKLPKIEINNKTYIDIQFLNYPSPNPYDWVRRIYYAKNIGCIKFEDENGKVWELIRYKIKQ